jgi:hypothetical protein
LAVTGHNAIIVAMCDRPITPAATAIAPSASTLKRSVGVDKVMTRLPVDRNFHVVFTIPACLHQLFLLNQASAYDLLFKAAGKALKQCAQNPDFWVHNPVQWPSCIPGDKTCPYHPHIHMIVPTGGLSEDQIDGYRLKNGNYTHRVAVSNQRLLDHKDGQVSFGYKDYKLTGIQRIMHLEAMEFIRRFMQHVLPYDCANERLNN